MPAAIAELTVRRICLAAFWAGYFQWTAAFVAELSSLRVVKLAFWAFHLFLTVSFQPRLAKGVNNAIPISLVLIHKGF